MCKIFWGNRPSCKLGLCKGILGKANDVIDKCVKKIKVTKINVNVKYVNFYM